MNRSCEEDEFAGEPYLLICGHLGNGNLGSCVVVGSCEVRCLGWLDGLLVNVRCSIPIPKSPSICKCTVQCKSNMQVMYY